MLGSSLLALGASTKDCEHWATMGECEKNPESMLSLCPQSCGTCQELELFKKDEL